MADFSKPVWQFKFELAPGKWVFVPNEATKEYGRQLKRSIESLWHAPNYFVHLGTRGHVRALRDHLPNSYFARIDIKSFYNSINKSRVTRNLTNLFNNYDQARGAAVMSTVPDPSVVDKPRYILPFGFVQSPVLATLCLANSKLGTALRQVASRVTLSAYVDDFVISTRGSLASLTEAYEQLIAAAEASKFEVNVAKLSPPAEHTTVFNIDVAKGHLEISADRLTAFHEAAASSADERVVSGILGYVRSVNATQAKRLATRLSQAQDAL